MNAAHFQHQLYLLLQFKYRYWFQCECGNNVCQETKQKLEICRPHVMRAVKNDTIVTCEVAQWICAADATCSKALEYYHKYCQSMFSGRKCSFRCKNSIAILRKQEKAAKLDTCRCNGREEYNCPQIRVNMAKLCFNETIEIDQVIDVESNNIKPNIISLQKINNTKFFNNTNSGTCAFSSLTYLTYLLLSLTICFVT